MWKKLSFNVKLLSVFAMTVALLSAVHLVTYLHLLGKMREEIIVTNTHHLSSAASHLDHALSGIDSCYQSMRNTNIYRQLSRSGSPDGYDFTEFSLKMSEALQTVQDISGWVVFFKNSPGSISSGGYYLADDFTRLRYVADGFDSEFWRSQILEPFSRRFYPETKFTLLSPSGMQYTRELMPTAFKSYWNSNLISVLFLDIRSLCEQADSYLSEGFSIFGSDGTLLYSSDAVPMITSLEQADSLPNDFRGHLFRCPSSSEGLTYLKYLPESTATEQLQRNVRFSVYLSLGALVLILFAALTSLRHLLVPVNKLFRLVQQHSSGSDATPQNIYREVEAILEHQHQQAQELAQKDRELSEYFLRLQLKNIYVRSGFYDPQAGAFSLLYIRIHYRSDIGTLCAMPVCALERQLQELLELTLKALFDSTLVFQLDPGRFIARISAEPSKGNIDETLSRFMMQLENEKEHAFFTVIQSRPAHSSDDLSELYSQLLDAEQYALVQDSSQLLRLPIEPASVKRYQFSPQTQAQLRSLIVSGCPDEAAEYARGILRENRDAGTCRAQFILLCIAVVNTAVYALALTGLRSDQLSSSSNIYELLNHCMTFDDYVQVVNRFICSICPGADVPAAEDPLLQKAYDYIDANFAREFSIEEMAQALHVSRSHLSSYFKSKTEMNLSDAIGSFRMRKAIELLHDPDIRIADIGPQVGIENSNTFLRQFKKFTGLSPNEYRKKNLP